MMLKIVVLAVLAYTAYSKPGARDGNVEFTPEELSRYFGVTSHQKAPEYEIVYPLVVTNQGKRSVGKRATAASFLEVEVEAFGETLTLVVDHDDSSFSPGLEAEIYTDEGIQRVPVRTDCVYTGKVAGEKDSLASVTACDGLMAVIHRKGHDKLYIERLDDDHASKRDVGRGYPHVAYKNRPVEGGIYCETAERDPPVLPEDFAYDPPILPIDTETTKYLELAFIADSLYTSSKGSSASAQTCVTALFNAVKNVLQRSSLRGSNLVPKLRYVKIFGASESGLTSNSDGETYLRTGAAWQDNHKKSVTTAEKWDNAAILTGRDISSPTAGNNLLGIAFVGECNYWGTSLSEFRGMDATDVTSHEIGHNLGMFHDSEGPTGGPNNNCGSSGYIMAAHDDDHRKDLEWSSCSRSYYETRITKTSCYNDA